MAKGKMVCVKCGEEKNKTKEFYISRSKLYGNNEGRIPLCKKCIIERFESLKELYQDDIKALYHLCMNFDVYFSKDLADSAYAQSSKEGIDCVAKIYFQKVNSLAQYRSKSSIDSDYIILDEKVNYNRELTEEEILEIEDSDVFVVTPKIRKRWGRGYTNEDYEELEDFYEEYKNNLDHENNFMKLEIIREMCTIKHIRDKAKRDGDYKTAREYSDLLSKKMTDANLKPSQQKVFGEADEDVYSMKMKIIENERPICSPLPEFIDVDGFWKYINRHMIKPFANALGLAKGDYTIEGGSENIEIDDKLNKELEGAKDED